MANTDVAQAPAPQAATEHKPYLRVFGYEGGSQEMDLPATQVLIGRAREVDVLLAAQDVSRRHAVIYPVNGGYAIEDCDSRSGTVVNGRRVKRAMLSHADAVEISHFVIEYRTDAKSLEEQKANAGRSASILSKFNYLPDAMKVRYRIIEIPPEEAFEVGDTFTVDGGGILLRVDIDVMDDEILEIEITWPNGSVRRFMGEKVGQLTDGTSDICCIKLHHLDRARHQAMVNRSPEHAWNPSA